jgi:hypothetical protein
MTKGELRKARKEAHANGQALTGELAIAGQQGEGNQVQRQADARRKVSRAYKGERKASRAEQYGRYLDSGHGAWDDRESPSGDY